MNQLYLVIASLLGRQSRKSLHFYLRLGSETETRAGLSLIENGVDTLEEDVTKDRHANTIVGLNATVASAAAGRSKVDVAARDDEGLATNSNVEVRQSRAAREDVAALGAAVRRAGDLGVVGLDSGVGDEEEGGAGVSDGGADAAGGGGGANAVAAGGKLPEALAAADGDVGDGAGVLGGVDEAEVVAAGFALLEVDGEELLLERGLHGVEEGVLPRRADGVDGAEREAEEAVVVGVLGELGRDLSGGLNCLRGGSDGADDDLVGVDVAAGTRAVLVADVPGCSSDLLAGCGGVVLGVAGTLAGGSLGGEHPTVRSSVKRTQDRSIVTSTYRSELPVSKSKFRVCPPTVTGQRYSESY